ncbi:hypothetical protein LCGC14_1666810 [marine sediment metagenome]|uniref:Uncharacterized protein n=1 Tax=marine sediment metagenome TaxID=412755 RepID=A0A0F9IF26_9ZZZZ
MNPATIQLLVRLALVLLSVSKDLATTSGQTDSQIAAAVRTKADKAIRKVRNFWHRYHPRAYAKVDSRCGRPNRRWFNCVRHLLLLCEGMT